MNWSSRCREISVQRAGPRPAGRPLILTFLQYIEVDTRPLSRPLVTRSPIHILSHRLLSSPAVPTRDHDCRSPCHYPSQLRPFWPSLILVLIIFLITIIIIQRAVRVSVIGRPVLPGLPLGRQPLLLSLRVQLRRLLTLAILSRLLVDPPQPAGVHQRVHTALLLVAQSGLQLLSGDPVGRLGGPKASSDPKAVAAGAAAVAA